jgi:acetyl-CoA acetyltransferase
MIGGGAHSMIHPFGVTGFNRLTALSMRTQIRRARRARLITIAAGLCSVKARAW